MNRRTQPPPSMMGNAEVVCPSEPDSLLLGDSKAMRQVRARLDRVAEFDCPVRLEGAPGTGKTIAAEYLHMRSHRRQGPFVVCPASLLADTLALSELIGHSQGAFTGADRDSQGVFEEAHTGTLFVDEIATAAPAVQRALLHLIRNRGTVVKIKRLRDRRVRPVDVRLIVASNVSLEEEARAGRFRTDLLDRLGIILIRMPELQQRRSDIRPLFERQLVDSRRETGQDMRAPTPLEWKVLEAYDWPGNVRELISVASYFVVFRKIPPIVWRKDWRERLPDVLEETDGNVSKAARMFDLSRPTVYAAMRKVEGSGS